MNLKSRSLWITHTAIFIALIIVLQFITAPLGNILITGSLVNLLLVVSVMTCGLSSGIVVSLFSPVMAKIFGIGPFWGIIPFIVLGDLTLVLVWYFIGSKAKLRKPTAYIVALVIAAVTKFLILYFGIVKLAVPVLLKLPNQQAKVVSNMFSVPQLITAVIGGAAATVILPVLQKSLKTH